MPTIHEIHAENALRNAVIAQRAKRYDPIRGIGSAGTRTPITILGTTYNLPTELINHPNFDPLDHHALRIRYDFEYWCATSYQVRDPKTNIYTNLIPTYPQRLLIHEATKLRQAPPQTISPRLMVLHDARLGITTISAAYIHWLKFVVRPHANAIIFTQPGITHRQTHQFAAIRYINRHDYPQGRHDEMRFRNTRTAIRNIDSYIYYFGSQSMYAAQGMTFNYLLLSGASMYDNRYSNNFRSIYRSTVSVLDLFDSMFIIESNASCHYRNSDFYDLWHSTLKGKSLFKPLYIPWHKSEKNFKPLTISVADFWNSLTKKEYFNLWVRQNCTLEQINYYRHHINPKKDLPQRKHLKGVSIHQQRSQPITRPFVGANRLPKNVSRRHHNYTPADPIAAPRPISTIIPPPERFGLRLRPLNPPPPKKYRRKRTTPHPVHTLLALLILLTNLTAQPSDTETVAGAIADESPLNRPRSPGTP